MKTKIILLLILSIIITACSSSNEPSTKDETDSQISEETLPEESYLDKLGKRDFGGETFKIIGITGIFSFDPGEEFTGEPINDSMIMRNRMVEEKYNIKIEYIYPEESTNALRNSIAAGDYLCDMMISSIISLSGLAPEGLLYNIAALPYLTLDSSPWWSNLIYSNLTYSDKLFFITGDISPGMYMAPSAVYVNLKLLQDYKITENLYDLVFSGNWILDVLERLTKDKSMDLNGNGRMHADDDFFGFIQQDNTLASNSFCAGFGIKLSTIKNDTIIVDFISEISIQKIDKLANFLVKPAYVLQNDIITKTFHDGRAIFLTHFLESSLLFLRTMEEDYGILPMPKYDEAQESYISALNPWNPSSLGVPLLIDPEKVGFVMEALGYASYELVRPNVYELTLKTKFARDSESARVIDLIIETSYLDLNCVYNFGGSTDIVRNTLFDKTPLLSAYNSIESKIQGAIDTYIEKLSEQ